MAAQNNTPLRKALLVRYKSTEQGTFGALFLDGKFFCYTGELPWYDNKPNISCIPACTYSVRIKLSPTYGEVYEIQDVEGRTYIYFHAGNYCGDKAKGWRSDSLGCILLGAAEGELDSQDAIVSSRYTVRNFMNELNGEPFELTIQDCYE